MKTLITCEHGGNRVPSQLKKNFSSRAARSALNSHRGWDPGALAIARGLATKLKAPLFFSQTSRLVVDLNRSEGHRKLHSEFMPEDRAIRAQWMENLHRPFRSDVESWLRRIGKTVHFSIHSFTPTLNGEIRTCEIGLLYDPKRPSEKKIASALRKALKIRFPDARIRMNYPYRGYDDGHTTLLRRKFPRNYSGLEIEFNQGWLKKRSEREIAIRLADAIQDSV